MARAYIVIARNDLPDNFLQVLDLWPNVSQRSPAITPPGQTHYLSHMPDQQAVATAGAGPVLVDGDTYGLTAYLVANVADNPGNGPLPAADANNIATRIYQRAAEGLPLTVDVLNSIIQTVTAGGGTLDGSGPDNSTGSVEDILRILAGEVYLATDGLQIGDGVPNFVVPVSGEFVSRPNVESPLSVRTSTGLPVRGRGSFVGKAIPTLAPVQSTTAGSIEDTRFRDVVSVVDSGALQQSALNGALSKMASPEFTFQNTAFTYGAGGTAQTLSLVSIGGAGDAAPYQARAVTVYAADGTIIV